MKLGSFSQTHQSSYVNPPPREEGLRKQWEVRTVNTDGGSSSDHRNWVICVLLIVNIRFMLIPFHYISSFHLLPELVYPLASSASLLGNLIDISNSTCLIENYFSPLSSLFLYCLLGFLGSYCCHNEIPQAGRLKQQKICFHSFGD